MFWKRGSTGCVEPKTLCLTFDDGPGEKTLVLAEYLYREGIGAAFFFVGKFIPEFPGILEELVRLGHIVGNHTYSHPDIRKLYNDHGDVVTEISRTDDLIAGHLPDRTMYFRAPYGFWHTGAAVTLNKALNAGSIRHLGPIHWDIDTEDWIYWQRKRGAERCARHVLKLLKKRDSGIVLMHDSSVEEDIRRHNLTYEMIQVLVPELKGRGYKFIRLDEIETW